MRQILIGEILKLTELDHIKDIPPGINQGSKASDTVPTNNERQEPDYNKSGAGVGGGGGGDNDGSGGYEEGY